MQSTITRYGLIYGLVGVLVFVLGTVTGLMDFSSLMSSILFGLIGIAIGITVLVIGIKAYRDEIGGFLTFGQAFGAAFGIMIIGTVVSTLGQYIYTNFIDPSFYDTMAEQMQEMLERVGAPEDQIQMNIDKIKDSNSFFGILKNFLTGSIFMTFFALIVAAIMKKQPESPFQNEPLDQL
jgi:hypothetical protein